MAQTTLASCEQYSDEALMRRYFELSAQPDENTDELVAIDAAIQQRLFATYGRTDGAAPRIRLAAFV